MPNPIHITPGGGIPVPVLGNTVINGGISPFYPTPVIVIDQIPIQVVGFVPLTPCNATECRTWCECPYILQVFGNTTVGGGAVSASTYENDMNDFTVDYPQYLANPNATITFIIQKKSGSVWTDIVTVNDNTYGLYTKLGTNPQHPSWAEFTVNWGKVYVLQGEGFYRIQVRGGIGSTPLCFLVSEAFCLRKWSCILADGTTKFEATVSGTIGSIDKDGYLFDLCGVKHFDSIRMKGMLGFEETEYREEMLEYNTGLMERERDEALQKFQWKTTPKGLPKWLLDRFKVYGLMADTLLGSDYCMNNSDYDLKQKMLIKAGGFKPVYRVSSRKAKVIVDFAEGIQNVIKSNCCVTSGL